MPVENIFAAYARPVRSVMDYQNDMDQRDLLQTQLQGARRQNAIADLTAVQTQDTMRQGTMARQAARFAAEQAKGNPVEYARLLQVSGYPENIPLADQVLKAHTERIKGEAAAGKDTAETDKVRQSMQKAALMDHIQTIGGLSDATQVADYLKQANDIAPARRSALLQSLQSVRSLPELQQWQARAVLTLAAPDQQAKAMQPNYQGAGGSMVNTNPLAAGAAPIQITQSADNAATQATALAGQRRMAADAAAGRDQSERLAAGAVTYQQDADGNLVALPARAVPGTVIKAQAVTAPGAGMVPLPGKDANMTEGQAKALSFGARMQQNRQVLDQLEAGGTFRRGNIKAAAETAGRVLGLGTDTFGGTLADIGGSAANVTQSPEQQRYETAMRNWIAANLRKESGAVIGTDEYRQAENQYFPQLGDSPKVIADKAALRRTAEQTMLAEVPRNKRTKDGAAPTTPKAGAVLRFDAQGNLLP